jgi:coproporphyrinogen III oxidase-like Fe-S oxidoreductase
LRTVWGCDLNEIKNQFGNDFALRFKEKVLTKKGLVENRNDVFVLTREGLLQADGIASDLFVV